MPEALGTPAAAAAPPGGGEDRMGSELTMKQPSTAEAGLDPIEICTLPADGLGERLAWVRAEILAHAVSSERSADGIVWQLDDAPGLAAKLDHLVALERECCAGIVFEHAPAATAGRRRLAVHGIDPQASVFSSLHVAAAGPPELGARVAKAAGLGAALSLLVCCVLPIGVAALFGAGVAAPFASLDNPWGIAGAALLSGGAAFAWQGRNRTAPKGGAEACGRNC